MENDTAVKKGNSGKKVVKPVPKEKDVEAVLAYMKENEASSVCQNNALKALQELVKTGKKISGDSKKLVAMMMRKHIAKEDVQTAACRLLAVLATDGKISMSKLSHCEGILSETFEIIKVIIISIMELIYVHFTVFI